MPTFFQRPENALKRANEFIDVGKKQRALDALYDVIKSKKHRTWQKIHEPILEKYLELCVELKKSHVAKEGLYQYKNICQQVNIKSLEDVVRKYLALAEEKTEEARQESHQAVVDIDDLDVLTTPENLLLSAVSGEDTQDRTDRAILTPWVKFLWESYRQCLDLLRNNSSVEKLYQDIAQQAFKFCLKYTRKTEFRKLCDNLRTHLGHIHKHQHQQRAINLNNPESQAMHLETRLVQLDSAIQMELWQEAFKAVEDIHGLIALSKKPPKPALMANYYQKLGLVFWKSGNHMFHACAWHRLFHLSREQRKNLSPDELLRMASRVMCATLAVPIPASRNQVDQVLGLDENQMEKQRRLATLLGLSSPPTRTGLVKDLMKYNVIQHVYPELQNLYRYLEVDFHPLNLSQRVQAPLEFIEKNEELSQYVTALQDITITRLLKQIAQVYQTIEFARFAALAPFASHFHLERIVVNAAKNLDLQVRIDHRTLSLSFGTDLGVSQKEDVPEGPYLQSMPSENIRNQIIHMARALDKAIAIIQPKSMQTLAVKRDELRAHIIQSYRQTAKKEHQRILMRRQIIEERKEELENINVQREQEEAQQIEDQRKKQYDAEKLRLEKEAEQRDHQRRVEERKDIQRKAAKEKLDQLRSTAIGAKVFADMDENILAELDADEIMAKQVEQLEKEKKEMQEKLRQQEKKVDYFERAKRVEEIPLLEKQYEDDNVKAEEFWEQQEQQRIELLKTEREDALSQRDRLIRIVEDKDEFLSQLKDSRMSVYKDKLDEFEKKLGEERKRRLLERKEKRKEEKRQKWIMEKEEEEQRKKDEELKRQREEEERLEKEMQEKAEAEYKERLMKLEEIAEKQRQREREIEERDAKRREEQRERAREERDRPREDERGWRRGGDGERDRGGRFGDGNRDRDDRPKEDNWRRGGDQGQRDDRSPGEAGRWKPSVSVGGWREREKAREDSWRKPSERESEDRGTESQDRPRDREPSRELDRGPPSRDLDRGPPPRDFDRAPPARDFDRGPPRDEGRNAWRDSAPVEREEGRSTLSKRGGMPRDIRLDDPDNTWGKEKREERERERDEGQSGWRDRGPPRDDTDRGGGWRGAPRDSGDFRDEGRGGGGGGGWRDRGPPRDDRDRDEGRGGGWRDRGPPRDRDDGPSGGGAWRDRGPARDDRDRDEGRSAWRDSRGPPRDEGPPRERGGFEDRNAWRDGPKDDRGARAPPARDDGDKGAWRRGDDRDKKPAYDDRGPPARVIDDRGPPARVIDDRGPPARDIGGGGGGGAWRDKDKAPAWGGDRGGAREERSTLKARDDNPPPPPPKEEAWKRGGSDMKKAPPTEDQRPPPRESNPPPGEVENDGWTQVRR